MTCLGIADFPDLDRLLRRIDSSVAVAARSRADAEGLLARNASVAGNGHVFFDASGAWCDRELGVRQSALLVDFGLSLAWSFGSIAGLRDVIESERLA